METVNSQQTQRVWQRLYAQTDQSATDETGPLICGEWETSAVCTLLARRCSGKFAPQLRQLARRSRSRWACLQGFVLLNTGKRPPHSHPDPAQTSAVRLLENCCREALRRVSLYRQCPSLPAPVADLLAQEQARDARLLLEILGNWER